MIRALMFAALGLLATAGACSAGDRVVPRDALQFTDSGEPMPLLPSRYRNHCGWERGHFYCANHCGTDYQFYYCTPASFGCCDQRRCRCYCDD